MRKILFPTDFSNAANNAFVYALHLAEEMEAGLYVLNTFMQPVLSATHAGQPELVPEVYENYELQQFENFKKNSADLRKMAANYNLSSVPLTFIFEEGTVVTNAQRIIAKEGIHLVIMGTNRADGVIDKIFGSNTLGVIRGIKTPVLSVPREAKYKGIKEILFTTLFREKDETALRQIMEIARKFHVKVKCVHVLKDRNVEIISVTDRWRRMFPEDNLDFILLDMEQSTEQTLNRYIESNRVDLLCVVKRNKNLLEQLFKSSMSNRLRMHANTATLVLHEGNDSGSF